MSLSHRLMSLATYVGRNQHMSLPIYDRFAPHPNHHTDICRYVSGTDLCRPRTNIGRYTDICRFRTDLCLKHRHRSKTDRHKGDDDICRCLPTYVADRHMSVHPDISHVPPARVTRHDSPLPCNSPVSPHRPCTVPLRLAPQRA